MEEVLYDVEINRNDGQYVGKLYSDFDGIKEFSNERIDKLLRDIIFDMQLAHDQFSSRSTDFME
jgi:hypothetical protein